MARSKLEVIGEVLFDILQDANLEELKPLVKEYKEEYIGSLHTLKQQGLSFAALWDAIDEAISYQEGVNR